MAPSPVIPKVTCMVYSTPEQKARILSEVKTDEKRLERDALTLLDWVNKQPHLPNLDESELYFLKLYLVGVKNSMETAKKGLDTYYTARTAFQNIFRPRPFTEDELNEVSKYASVFAAPMLTKSLTRVLIIRYTNYNPAEGDIVALIRTKLLKADLLFRMDWQAGVEIVFDLSNYLSAHSIRFLRNVGDAKNCLHCLLDALPARVKAIHFFNAPPVFNTAHAIITPFLKEKIRSRLHMHTDLKSLHKSIPPSYLPSELGGELSSCLEMEAKLTKNIVESADFLAYQHTHISDESRRPGGPSRLFQGDSYGLEGSFRKIELD